jgi:hypothetical protein
MGVSANAPRARAVAGEWALLLLLLLLDSATAFVPPPARRPHQTTTSSLLWRCTTKPSLLPRPSSASSSPSVSPPDLTVAGGSGPHQEANEKGVVDSHWTQGNVVAQLRSGGIVPFTWPNSDVVRAFVVERHRVCV